MARSVTIAFAEIEIEQIDRVMADTANRGAGVGTLRELVRHATLVYVDFLERAQAGDLDGSASARLLSETVPGLDPFRERKIE